MFSRIRSLRLRTFPERKISAHTVFILIPRSPITVRTRSRKKAKRRADMGLLPGLKRGEVPGPQTDTDSSLSAPGSLAVRK